MPFGYAAGQMLAQAVTETKSLDHEKLAEYIHSHSFKTVVGEIVVRQGRRMVEAAPALDAVPERRAEQSRSVPRSGAKQPILWPPEYKSGKMIYPYADARKK